MTRRTIRVTGFCFWIAPEAMADSPMRIAASASCADWASWFNGGGRAARPNRRREHEYRITAA
jgi:hypothetical protein